MKRLAALRRRVLAANREIAEHRLSLFSWGNASEIDRRSGLVAIKPSGMAYAAMGVDDIVVVDLDGTVVAGRRRPSTDLATHLALYRAFPAIGGVVHTHSHYATAFAQAGVAIDCLGTTHADSFRGAVPVTRALRRAEIAGDYERNTGAVIAERFRRGRLDPLHMPAVLVRGHAPFTWGASAHAAVEHAAILECVAEMNLLTRALVPRTAPIARYLLDRHFLRKHGTGAYYGQSGR